MCVIGVIASDAADNVYLLKLLFFCCYVAPFQTQTKCNNDIIINHTERLLGIHMYVSSVLFCVLYVKGANKLNSLYGPVN